MNTDDILRAAVKCQLITTGNRDGLYADSLVRFASLILAEALAEQEPVAWRGYTITNGYTLHFHYGEAHRVASKIEPLYTAPQPAKQPLTDEQLWANDEIMALNADLGWHMDTIKTFARAIERAHGIGEQE